MKKFNDLTIDEQNEVSCLEDILYSIEYNIKNHGIGLPRLKLIAVKHLYDCLRGAKMWNAAMDNTYEK